MSPKSSKQKHATSADSLCFDSRTYVHLLTIDSEYVRRMSFRMADLTSYKVLQTFMTPATKTINSSERASQPKRITRISACSFSNVRRTMAHIDGPWRVRSFEMHIREHCLRGSLLILAITAASRRTNFSWVMIKMLQNRSMLMILACLGEHCFGK